MPGSVNELESAILDRRIRLLRNPVLISAMMSTQSSATPLITAGSPSASQQTASTRSSP
jgi:hypothetical protein